MKTLKKIAACSLLFAGGMVALHHAIWYSETIAQYATNLTIIAIAMCIAVVVVES